MAKIWNESPYSSDLFLKIVRYPIFGRLCIFRNHILLKFIAIDTLCINNLSGMEIFPFFFLLYPFCCRHPMPATKLFRKNLLVCCVLLCFIVLSKWFRANNVITKWICMMYLFFPLNKKFNNQVDE